MHYFIDGYNFLFRTGNLGENLKKEREEIIQNLSKKAEILDLDITLVFDSNQREWGAKSHFHGIEIAFSSFDEEADTYILNELDRSTRLKQEVVVTSDKILAKQVNKRHVKTETIEEFLEWLELRIKNKKKEKREIKAQTPPLPKKPKLKPREGSDEFYLEAFEKRLAEEVDESGQSGQSGRQ